MTRGGSTLSRPALPLALLALVLLAPSLGSAVDEPFAFSAPHTLHTHLGLMEPNLALAPDGTVYVSTLSFAVVPQDPLGATFRIGQTGLWRKDPGAPNFALVDVPNDGWGGLDESIAVGPDGRLAVASLYFGAPFVATTLPTNLLRCVSVVTSDDRGHSWSPLDLFGCHAPRSDRPWVTIDATGAVWVLAAAGGPDAPHFVTYAPRPGGPFLPAGESFPTHGGFPGNLFADRERGIVYDASPCSVPPPTSVCLAKTPSATPLPVWIQGARIPMQAPHLGLKRVVGTVDDAGNVYVAWADRRVPDASVGIYVARSTDEGASWSPPSRVSGATAGVMPWIAAGADGNVAVAWYEADRPAIDPNFLPPDTEWNVRLGVKRGGWDAPAGGWTTTTLTPEPNHRGDICTQGVACSANADRSLGEFFEIAVGADGRVHATWSDDIASAVRYAEQTAGPRLR